MIDSPATAESQAGHPAATCSPSVCRGIFLGPPPPPSPPNLAVGQLHAGVDPEKEEEDPVPLMKQLGPCAKPYIALQVIDPRSRVTEVFCVHASYHIIMMYIYNLRAILAASAGLPDGY